MATSVLFIEITLGEYLLAKFQFVGEPIEQRMSLPEAKQHIDPLMFPVWL